MGKGIDDIVNYIFSEFKKTTNIKLATIIVGALLSTYTINQATTFVKNQPIKKEQQEVLIKTINKYKDPLSLSLSKDGVEHIKGEERLKLKAYDINDGMISIGYGHAEPKDITKYKVGHKITEREALKLFHKDLTKASDGVKRMFSQWKEQGINVQITQNQFDVLVSMAFNMGVQKFRLTNFVQSLKNNDMEKAAELIKITGVSDKFPGLETRRIKEYEKFIS